MEHFAAVRSIALFDTLLCCSHKSWGKKGFKVVGWPTRGKGRGRENGRDSVDFGQAALALGSWESMLTRAGNHLWVVVYTSYIVQQSMPIAFV